jgi:dethiobiotin synthase
VTVLVVSGTGTGVGKTIVTAALAALAAARGPADGPAVVKPAQTGVADPPERPGPAEHSGPAKQRDSAEEPDLAVVTRLSGVTDTHELARFPDPLSPEAAARVSGRKPLDMSAAAAYIRGLTNRLVLVEGAGGLLVRYDPAGGTIADLAAMLDAAVLVVAGAALGTLNHTALTLEALRARGLTCAGVVIGCWPASPGLAERENLTDLAAAAGGPLAGLLPENAGALGREEFLAAARAGLSPALGGAFGSDSLASPAPIA